MGRVSRRLLDPKFRYVPSHSTDVRKTIRREQDRLKAVRDQQAKNEREADAKIAARIQPKKVAHG